MKKVFACLVMAGFLLASCGGSEEQKTEATPEATEATVPADTTAPAAADTTAAPAPAPAH